MAHDRRQRLGLGTYEQLLQVVSCRRTRVQPQRPNQAPEEPPPRREIRERIETYASRLSNSSSLAARRFFSLPLYFITSLSLSSFMFSMARRLETEEELYEVAVRGLMRRAHSVHEMKRKLERRSDNKLLVQVVMARLKENGMIDDAKYAKQFARQRTEGRKQGKLRISRDLRVRGVPDRHIEAALKETAEHNDERAMVRQRIERKLRSYRGEIDERKMASMYGSLLRAGFSADVVRRELKALTREEVPDTEAEIE